MNGYDPKIENKNLKSTSLTLDEQRPPYFHFEFVRKIFEFFFVAFARLPICLLDISGFCLGQ